jgi:hypothetical protein
MTSLANAFAALQAHQEKPTVRNPRGVNIHTVLYLDGRVEHTLDAADDLDLADVVEHPDRYALSGSAVLRFEAPPGYEPPRAEGGQAL